MLVVSLNESLCLYFLTLTSLHNDLLAWRECDCLRSVLVFSIFKNSSHVSVLFRSCILILHHSAFFLFFLSPHIMFRKKRVAIVHLKGCKLEENLELYFLKLVLIHHEFLIFFYLVCTFFWMNNLFLLTKDSPHVHDWKLFFSSSFYPLFILSIVSHEIAPPPP